MDRAICPLRSPLFNKLVLLLSPPEKAEIYVGDGSTKRRLPIYADWALVLLVILLFSLIRFRLRDMPLERDEGEYAYAGQLLLQGIPPYQLVYNMKLPGTYAAYAAILAVFGQTSTGVHLGLLLVNAMTTILVFLLARRLLGRMGGLVACTSYALLSTSTSVLGLAGHATQFVVLPAVAGILLLLKGMESRSNVSISRCLIVGAGALFGVAFLMKQPGFAFLLFAWTYLLGVRLKSGARLQALTELATLLSGAAIPIVLTVALLLRAGVFDRFWFWTFLYGSQYGSITSPINGLLMLLGMTPKVMGASTLIWMIAAIGLSAIRWNEKIRRQGFFLICFLLFSFIGVSAGLYFRSHYFVLMLPAVAVLAGAGVVAATEAVVARQWTKTAAVLPGAVFLLGFALSLAIQRDYFFRLPPMDVARRLYEPNPFPEAVEAARFLRGQTGPESRIAVFGSEPEIYFYSGRHSATGYIYTYGLMEPQKYAHKMQEEMIQEIEHAQPEYLVYVHSAPSWLQSPRSDTRIFSWAAQFLKNGYDQVSYSPAQATTEKLSVYRRRSLLSVRER